MFSLLRGIRKWPAEARLPVISATLTRRLRRVGAAVRSFIPRPALRTGTSFRAMSTVRSAASTRSTATAPPRTVRTTTRRRPLVKHLAVNRDSVNRIVIAAQHRMRGAIDDDLLSDAQFKFGRRWPNGHQISVIQHRTVHFAVAGIVQPLDGSLFVDKLFIASARRSDLFPLLGGERCQFINGVIRLAGFGIRRDLHIASGGYLTQCKPQPRRQIDLGRLLGHFQHHRVDIPARRIVEPINGAR